MAIFKDMPFFYIQRWNQTLIMVTDKPDIVERADRLVLLENGVVNMNRWYNEFHVNGLTIK